VPVVVVAAHYFDQTIFFRQEVIVVVIIVLVAGHVFLSFADFECALTDVTGQDIATRQRESQAKEFAFGREHDAGGRDQATVAVAENRLRPTRARS
jgi:hypothetical protein